jgi:aspartate aminotransferase/aminotransferase
MPASLPYFMEEPAVIAQRMAKLDASGIRKVFDLAAHMKDPINLSIGQPDFDVPEAVQEAAIEAIRHGRNKYTQTQGIADLHKALRERILTPKQCDPEGLLVTSGVSGALVLAFLVTVDPGDEVIIPDPYFVMYKHLVNLCDGVPVFADTYPDFQFTAERIRPLITPKTKMILLNNPANPTGALLPNEELEKIAALAREHDLLIISDEIYDFFTYGAPPKSMAALYPKTILMGGFSKSHAMTGWRLGYAAGPKDIIQEMTKLQQFSFVCAPSFAQYAGLVALDVDTTPFRDAYKLKRDMIYEGLRDAGYDVRDPGGAFYIFPRAPWGTDAEFVAAAIKNELLVIPGSVFSEKHSHFRISYAATDETIRKGLAVLKRLIQDGPPKG